MRTDSKGCGRSDRAWARRARLAALGLILAAAVPPAFAAVMRSVSEALTGQGVPDARSETVEGRPFTLSSLRGRPALVSLFTSWCPVCQAEHQEVLSVYRDYASRGLQFVGVLLDPRETPDTVGRARELLRKSPLPFPVIMMNDSLGQAFANQLGNFPATYFITADGRFSTTLFGMQPRAQIAAIAERLVSPKQVATGQEAAAPTPQAGPVRAPWERSPWLALAPGSWEQWHPQFIHFPIAVLVFEALIVLISLARPSPAMEQLSRWLLIGAVVSFVPVIYTGISDVGVDLGPGWAFWNGLQDRIRHLFLLQSTISLHVLFALVTVVITVTRLLWRRRSREWPPPRNQLVAFAALTLLGLWALFAAGQVGGSISHR